MTSNQKQIIEIFKSNYKSPKSELIFNTPYELLVAVILSAQCTDKRVNIVTKELFKVASTPDAMVDLGVEQLEKYIKSCGFYHNKAKNIIDASRDIILYFKGNVPNNMKDLMSLAGVGEKTASVVMAVAYNVPSMPVDTHMQRLSNRLGFVNNLYNPHKISIELQKIVPKDFWIDFHHSMILHGRYVCTAKNPKCDICILKNVCKSKVKFNKV